MAEQIVRLYVLGVLCGMFMTAGILWDAWWGALVAIAVVVLFTTRAYFAAREIIRTEVASTELSRSVRRVSE
jgi:uncharacterized membrane protein YdjX (TVP38/TMEM64 family)